MKQKLVMLTMMVMFSAQVDARYHSVHSQKEFESVLNKYPYGVVCFAPSRMQSDDADSKQKREMKHDCKAVKNHLKSASERETFRRYLDKDVAFVFVDTALRYAQELADEYRIDEFPSCLLFKDGVVVRGYRLDYPKSAADLIQFLRDQFGDQIDGLVKERKEDERDLRKQRIGSAYAWPDYWRTSYWDWPCGRVRGYPWSDTGTLDFGYGWVY